MEVDLESQLFSIFTHVEVNMCKYCDNIKEEIDSLERQDADLLGQQGVGTDLIIVKKDDKYYFNVIGSFDSVKESVEIEFCPVCGRKLNGDLGNYAHDYCYEDVNSPYNQTSAIIDAAWKAVPAYTGYCGETACYQESYRNADEYYNNKYHGGTSNDALLDLIDTIEEKRKPKVTPNYHYHGGGLSG